MSRRRRERAIRSIVAERTVRTQSELAEALRDRGIEASQSTVSRDVKRLGLVKVPADDGGYRYGRPEEATSPAADRERLRDAVGEFVTEVTGASAMLALKTPPGGADPVAAALDRAELDGVAATLAGDDTVLVLVSDGRALDELRDRLEGWL